MTLCDECGLPMPVCNMRGLYFRALKLYALGREKQGAELATMADEEYRRYKDWWNGVSEE